MLLTKAWGRSASWHLVEMNRAEWNGRYKNNKLDFARTVTLDREDKIAQEK